MKNKKSIKPFWKFMAVSAIIFVLWFGYVFAVNIIAQSRYVLEVKPYAVSRISYELIDSNLSNQEIKQELDALFGAGWYIYAEKEMQSSIGAKVNLTFRKITMNTLCLSKQNEYTFYLAHELTHLKYYTGNECFTEYTAIITLYESGNEYFKNVALWRANDIVATNLQDEYDCGYYLLEYFGQ